MNGEPTVEPSIIARRRRATGAAGDEAGAVGRVDALCMEALAGSNAVLARALLRLLQEANGCRGTGAPCEADWRTCGCAVERSERERAELEDG